MDYVTTVLINGVAADLTMTGPVPLPAISADTSKTGNTTNANATVAIADTTGLYPNMYASGSGIPTGTTISSVGGSSITLSANAAATATGVSLSFTAIRATVL